MTGANKYTRATNNCLIKKRLLGKYKDPFDPEYGLRIKRFNRDRFSL